MFSNFMCIYNQKLFAMYDLLTMIKYKFRRIEILTKKSVNLEGGTYTFRVKRRVGVPQLMQIASATISALLQWTHARNY